MNQHLKQIMDGLSKSVKSLEKKVSEEGYLDTEEFTQMIGMVEAIELYMEQAIAKDEEAGRKDRADKGRALLEQLRKGRAESVEKRSRLS